MDNQRPLLFMSLIFLGFLIWQAWVADHAPIPVETATPETALEQTANRNDLPDAAESLSTTSTSTAKPSTPQISASADIIHVRTDVLDVKISTRGGDIIDVELPTYPVSLKEQDNFYTLLRSTTPRYIAQSGLLHNKIDGQDLSARAPNHYALFSSEQSEYVLQTGDDSMEVPLRWINEEGIVVEKVYTFYRDQFVVDLEHRVTNSSETEWVGRQYRQLRRTLGQDDDGPGLLGTQAYVGTAYFDEKYKKLKFKNIAEEKLDKDITGGWVSMVEHYFISAWIPDSQESAEKVYATELGTANNPDYSIGLKSASQSISPGQAATFKTRFYAGPKLHDRVSRLAPGLDLTSDYGIFTVIARPIFWMLRKIQSVVINWGWSIIILTILIKLVFYKLSETSYRSMANMRKLAPKLKELKDRCGDDKQKYQQAMMEIYKKEKINPMGGCLPILIQIPVFISLYWVLLEAVELRQAPWMLWIKDLSIMDPYFILPLLMGVSMFIQQKLNPAPPDPIQAKIFMALPFVFTIFFAFFPAGLVLYWFVNNLLSISQQWVITRRIEQAGN